MKRWFAGYAAIGLALWLMPRAVALADGGLAPGGSPGPETVTTGTCKKASNIDFAVADDGGNMTTSTSPVDVPGMSVDFIAKGKGGCAKVEFSAMVFANMGELLEVQAVLDGTTVCPPGLIQLSGDDDEDANGKWARSHAFNFLCPNLAPGPHNIKIQWLSFGGVTVFMHQRSLFVHHK